MSNTTNVLTGIAAELSGLPCVSFLNDVQLSDGLLQGSIKGAAVIACSDMGCSLPHVCSAPDADLFLFQNFGNKFDNDGFAELVSLSGVEHVVVYGHSRCQYSQFVSNAAGERPARDHKQSAGTNMEALSDDVESDGERFLKDWGQYNVLVEMKRVLTDPVLARIASQGKLNIHGWFYDSSARQLEVFDPKERQFVRQQFALPDSFVVKFIPEGLNFKVIE